MEAMALDINQKNDKMKRYISLVLIIAALMPMALQAQIDEDFSYEFGGRLSVGAEKKLGRGMRLTVEEEMRLDNNFSSLNRLQTTVGFSYKVNDYLKLGVGVAMINHYDSDDKAFDNTRFRLMLDATGSVSFGVWRLSLKERLQPTLRAGDYNPYQNPTLAVSLKSRLKVQYKGWRKVEPFAYVEMRNVMFAPVVVAYIDTVTSLCYTEDGSEYGDAGWFIDSYTGAYVNRLRGSLGVDWRLDKRNSINIAILADYAMDKNIDANSDGTKLKTYTREHAFTGWIAAGYTLLF